MKYAKLHYTTAIITLAFHIIPAICAGATLLSLESAVSNYGDGYGYTSVVVLAAAGCAILHSVIYMRHRLLHPVLLLFSSLVLAGVSIAIMCYSFASTTISIYHGWDQPYTYIEAPLMWFGLLGGPSFVYYVVHFIVSIVRLLRPLIDAHSHKVAIQRRQKAYAQLDKFYDYLQRGIITQAEYDASRAEIMSALGNSNT